MAKFKYSIPTPYGIETRTSAAKYTHIVVAGAESQAYRAKYAAEWVRDCKAAIAKDPSKTFIKDQLAVGEKMVADAQTYVPSDKGVLVGYCSRADLADKLAATTAKRRVNVVVVEITPAMVKEVKPRK
jgi:hypothetical protein